MGERLKGKIAIITGGSRGLGAAHAEVFCEEGARVVIADVLEADGAELARKLASQGYEARFHLLDVTSEQDWAEAVSFTVAEFGGLSTLINNAGIYSQKGLEDETRESWDRMIAVDQTGVFLGMKTAMPMLVSSGNGAIVNISSVMGMMGMLSCFGYHAAKGAVRMMSKAAAVEYGSKNVRINSIYPGSVQAPSHQQSPAADSARVMDRTPMGRKGVPRDVAYASLFLCSDEAQFITAAELTVDGGMSAA